MKHFYVLLPLFFGLHLLSFAQYSAKEINVTSLLVPSATPGETPGPRAQQWEKDQDRVNGHINNSKLLKMKKVTDSIVSFFHDSCLSEGSYSPVWHGEYFSEKTSPGPIMKFGVQCDFNAQKAQLTIIANDIAPLLGHLAVNNEDFLTIKIPGVIKNDCPYFEYEHSKTWLITSGGNQLPYIPVTRKEYLQGARAEVNIIKNSVIDYLKQKMPVRPAAIQQAEKKAAIDQLNAQYSGIDLQVRLKQLLKNYQTDEEYLKENTEKGTAGLDSTLHLMDSLLNHWTANQLNKPAIVSVVAADFQGFEDGRSDKMLIRINATYLNPNLSVEKPQFFLVTWQYDPSDPVAAGIDRQLRERFDVEKLRKLLPEYRKS